MTALEFVLPGDPATRTGGYEYDRRIVAGLRARGWTVRVHALGDSFPRPTAADAEDAQRRFAGFPDGALVLVDGLAYGALPGIAARESPRLRLVALVHHPLAAETGLAPDLRAQLFASERAALEHARRVVVTGSGTARELRDYGVEPARIDVVEPGTDPVPASPGSGGAAPRLLCVATLTPRKGHLDLLEALAPLAPLPWTLDCVGSVTRDAAHAARVATRIDRLGLAGRVRLPGELAEDALAAAWSRADVYVSAAAYEGYGMAVAEALARGLPVVATRVGAAERLVGDACGRLVPPGDPGALGSALESLLADPASRAACGRAARAHAARLPRWDAACARFAAALEAVG